VDASTSINQRLIQLIAEKTKLSADQVNEDLNFEESGLDSFARIELILVVEEEFGIELSDSESANVTTVSDIVELITSKVENA